MSDDKDEITQAGAVELEEAQLEDASGGLLPAVKAVKLDPSLKLDQSIKLDVDALRISKY